MEWETGQQILNRGPWSVMGHTICINIWPLDDRLEDVPVHQLAIWIQAHGLPRGQMTHANAHLLGAVAGTVLSVENSNTVNGWRGFVRVRVNINTQHPLVPGVWIRCGSNPPLWVEFRYERISLFCYNCGRLSHSERFCNQPRSPRAERLGVWMITPAARRLTSGPQPDGERGWDRFQRQCFQSRQNSQQYSASNPSTQPLLQAASQTFFRGPPQYRSTLVLSEKSPSPVRDAPTPDLPPTTFVASSSSGPRDKGKAKLFPAEDLVVNNVDFAEPCLPIGSDQTLYPTLGLSGEINLGHTQFFFDNSLSDFVPIPTPLQPYPFNHTQTPLHTLYSPSQLPPTPNSQSYAKDSLEALVAPISVQIHAPLPLPTPLFLNHHRRIIPFQGLQNSWTSYA
ncbi:putative transcription factor interactor and regulator CCHC(Zn) family [Rosa chinensis]|uniref:Putative transcription factor interactor and regulator CCHC(Zn) family n=1 Tax=Rosa chinensis TaxID=74649 RepID=A0A2P6PKD6_ROSCH|nr:putative transcription factor interactor and regulator CCHC(Zn) family [Rosa chinensis]